MTEAAKQLTNAIHSLLKEDGHFENNFIDESKFKARLYNSFMNSNIFDNTETLPTVSINIAFNLIKDIVRENIDTTLSTLMDKGLIKAVPTDDGEVGYILNESITE